MIWNIIKCVDTSQVRSVHTVCKEGRKEQWCTSQGVQGVHAVCVIVIMQQRVDDIRN